MIESSLNAERRVLTLTLVKRPWYAFPFLLRRGFLKSVPQYEAIPGLMFKAYHYAADGRPFGGFYLWSAANNAQNWFTPAWHDRIKNTYGVAGQVLYFDVERIDGVRNLPQQAIGNSLVVLDYTNQQVSGDASACLGKILVSSNGIQASIVFWNSKKEALAFHGQPSAATQYFNAPVIINQIRNLQS